MRAQPLLSMQEGGDKSVSSASSNDKMRQSLKHVKIIVCIVLYTNQ